MRRRTLLKTKSDPCDLCFYDRTTDSLIIVAGDTWNISTYPSSRYVPIGVVVVPSSHNVYGDGSCGGNESESYEQLYSLNRRYI